jgi:hypothetical protein
MALDWYQAADMAIRGAGGLLFISFAYLLVTSLRKCASEALGAGRGYATGDNAARGAPNEETTIKAADGSAHLGHAVKAAQHVISEACDRGIVRPEHVLFYDFVIAAARATMTDPRVAESVGRHMPLGPAGQSPH